MHFPDPSMVVPLPNLQLKKKNPKASVLRINKTIKRRAVNKMLQWSQG